MRTTRLIMIGLGMAIAAGVLTSFLQGRLGGAGAGKARGTPREVVVAVRDVPAGSVLTESDLSLAACPPDADASGASTMAAAIIGRTTVVSIRKGQLVRSDDLAARGSAAAIASELPPGFRAITVTLRDEGSGVALYPGASVDVLATVDGPVRGTSRTEAMTRLIVGRSRVLAVNDDAIGAALVGEKSGRTSSRRLTATLAVTPAQAAQIELASARGSIGVALCPIGDSENAGSEIVTTSSMLGLPPEPPVRTAIEREAAKTESARAEQVKVEPAKPTVTQPETAKPVVEAPKPTIWEVVVVRGQETERINFEKNPKAGAQPKGSQNNR
ncbi:MAG: Flp pilus assembly protein CpaB [bacterium]